MVQAKSPVVGVERRCDPRTDRRLSLVNLLRTRAEQARWSVAIVGTRDGHVLASSRGSGDRFAERAAAHLSCELFGRTAPVPGDGAFLFAPARRPELRLAGRTLSVRGEAVFVAVVNEGGEPDLAALGDAARGVARILAEPPSQGERS